MSSDLLLWPVEPPTLLSGGWEVHCVFTANSWRAIIWLRTVSPHLDPPACGGGHLEFPSVWLRTEREQLFSERLSEVWGENSVRNTFSLLGVCTGLDWFRIQLSWDYIVRLCFTSSTRFYLRRAMHSPNVQVCHSFQSLASTTHHLTAV